MVTISLVGLFYLCTGDEKLLMSFIPDPVCFRCCFGSFFQLLFGSLGRVQETNLKSVLLWARCIAPPPAVYIFPLLAG